jgi:hypothetical protein
LKPVFGEGAAAISFTFATGCWKVRVSIGSGLTSCGVDLRTGVAVVSRFGWTGVSTRGFTAKEGCGSGFTTEIFAFLTDSGCGFRVSGVSGSTKVNSMGSSSNLGVLANKFTAPEAKTPICSTSEPMMLKAKKYLRALASFSRCNPATLETLIPLLLSIITSVRLKCLETKVKPQLIKVLVEKVQNSHAAKEK